MIYPTETAFFFIIYTIYIYVIDCNQLDSAIHSRFAHSNRKTNMSTAKTLRADQNDKNDFCRGSARRSSCRRPSRGHWDWLKKNAGRTRSRRSAQLSLPINMWTTTITNSTLRESHCRGWRRNCARVISNVQKSDLFLFLV